MLLSVNSGMHSARPDKPRYDMVRETVGFFAENGFDALDVNFCPCIYEGDLHEPILDGEHWQQNLDELMAKCREKGMIISSTHLPYRYNYLDPQEDGYAENHAMTVRALQASEYIGAPWAVMHFKEEVGTEQYVKKLLQDAGCSHVGIAIENDSRFSLEALIRTHDRLLEAGYPVGICFDIGHCHVNAWQEYDVCQVIEMLGKRIKVLHLHDNKRDKDAHQEPYSGNIPWEAAMRALKKAGYEGEFNYELINNRVPECLRQAYAQYYREIGRYLISVFHQA